MRHFLQDEAYPCYPFTLSKLPAGWEATVVGDAVLDIHPGFASGVHNQEGVGVPHLRPMNIDRDGRVDLSVVKYVSPDVAVRLRWGDILFNNTNSPELVGKTTTIEREGEWAFSNHMTRLQPPPGICSGFVAFQLHCLFKCGYFRHRCTKHVNQASISSKTLAETVPLLIAPTCEQRRIVAEIEKQFTRLDAAVAALTRVQAGLKRYRASVLKAACEGRLVPTEAQLARAEGRDYEPADGLVASILNERRGKWEAGRLAKTKIEAITPKKQKGKPKFERPPAPEKANVPQPPEGWCWATVEVLGTFGEQAVVTGPFGTNLGSSDFISHGVPVLTIGCLTDSGVRLNKAVFVSAEKATELHRYRLRSGDLLFSRMASVGRAGIVADDLSGALFNYHIMRLRLAVEALLPKFFLAYVRGSAQVHNYIREVNHGATRDGINTEQLLAMPVALPPLSEQHRIVAEVERRLSVIDELESLVESNLKRAERLRQAILKRAFEGKLVPQDPNDEPANVLLERIRAERAAREQSTSSGVRKRQVSKV